MVSIKAGRSAGKKLKISDKKTDLHTPWSNFKPFSQRDFFRGMGVLPKNSAHLKINIYICIMNIIIDIPNGLLLGFEYYGPDDEFDFNELQISLLILRFTITWH